MRTQGLSPDGKGQFSYAKLQALSDDTGDLSPIDPRVYGTPPSRCPLRRPSNRAENRPAAVRLIEVGTALVRGHPRHGFAAKAPDRGRHAFVQLASALVRLDEPATRGRRE